MPSMAVGDDGPAGASPQRPATASSGRDEREATGGMGDQVHEYLQALCLDMARETLRSDDIELFHRSDHALLTHLADYFEKLKDKQRHEDSIAITRRAAIFLLRDVYAQAHLMSAATNLAERKALNAVQGELPAREDAVAVKSALQTVASTAAGPMMSQRAVREQLQSAKANVAALSEALELCRLLDSKFGHTVPFGQVNLTHVAAIFCTLVPCDSLFDLISLVFEALPPTRGAPGPDGRPGSARGTPTYRAADIQKIRIFECWASIDTTNADALRRVQTELLLRPNMTLPLLLEALPSIRHIHSASHEAAVASEAAQGRVVEYDEAAEAGPSSSGGGGPVVASYGEDDEGAAAAGGSGDGSDADTDSDEEAAPPANNFWAALVSGPEADA